MWLVAFSIITAALTPFADDGSVDEEAFVALVAHLLDNGSDGVVVAGTTGEGTTLTDDEKLRLFELAVSEFGDRGKIVAGTGSNDTAHTVHLTERRHHAGKQQRMNSGRARATAAVAVDQAVETP